MFQLRLKPLIKQHENFAILPVFLCFDVMKRFPALGIEPSSGEHWGERETPAPHDNETKNVCSLNIWSTHFNSLCIGGQRCQFFLMVWLDEWQQTCVLLI